MHTTLDAREMYLDLLRNYLTRYGEDELLPVRAASHPLLRYGLNLLAKRGFKLVREVPFDEQKRNLGLDWPAKAETMIGMQRLTSLQRCVETLLAEDVPGDLIECGVWRGGACILMKAVLAAYGDQERSVWIADSFAAYRPQTKRIIVSMRMSGSTSSRMCSPYQKPTLRLTSCVTDSWMTAFASLLACSKTRSGEHRLIALRCCDSTVTYMSLQFRRLMRCTHACRSVDFASSMTIMQWTYAIRRSRIIGNRTGFPKK